MHASRYSHRHMSLLPWTEYRERLASGCPLLLPAGALEQHGPHLPLSCDALLATAMAERLAEALDGLVLPALTYGYKSQARSGGGQTFPGTTSLDGHTLTCNVRDILRELARHGARQIAIVNGHVENQWFITEGIDLALRETTGAALHVVRCEYWNYTPQQVLDDVFDGPFPGVDLEHAALLETSMMLALHPELVRADRIPDHPAAQFPNHDRYPQDGAGVPDTGVLAPAGGATRARGERLIDSTVTAMARALATEFGIAGKNTTERS